MDTNAMFSVECGRRAAGCRRVSPQERFIGRFPIIGALTATLVFACFGLDATLASVAVADPANATEDILQEIVVTAERRESTVQRTPLSITAVSGEQLLEQGLTRLPELAMSTPGISMKQFAPGQVEYEMRGLPSSGGAAATVGMYVNDVPLAASANSYFGKAAIDPDLFDMQRIEVLRGPQGTLYGAGSMGGTIRLITAPPDVKKFEGASQAGFSDTAHGGVNWGTSVMVNLPIKDDVLALRVVGTDKYDDGFIDRIVVSPFPIGPTGGCGWPTCTRGDVTSAPVVAKYDKYNWQRLLGGRAALRFQPTEALTLDALAMYQGISAGGLPQADVSSVGIDALAHYQPFDQPDSLLTTFKIYSLAINYDMGFAALSSDTAKWIHNGSWTTDDTEVQENLLNEFYGFKPFVKTTFSNSDNVQQFSQELRLTSRGQGPLQWVAGLFYSDFESTVLAYLGNPALAGLSTGGPAANPLGAVYVDHQPYKMQQYAAFAEGSYLLTNELKASVGIRAFRYQATQNIDYYGIFTPSGNATPTVGGTTVNSSGTAPKINLSYEPSQNLTWYGQIAKGFRPGGANAPVPASLCGNTGIPSFGPDAVWDYEIGEKARLFNQRVQLNADFFYLHWMNVQQLLTLPCSYPFSDNVGTAESYGPELELTVRFNHYVTFSVNGAYTHAQFKSINSALLGNTIGATEKLSPGVPILNVPKYEASAAIELSYPVSDQYDFTARLSETTTGPSYDIDYYVGALPGYTLADLRLGLHGKRWDAYFFVRNLADKITELTIDTHSFSSPVPGLQTASVTTPRTIGLESNFKF
jgi:iron complex outermembrane receptor protein